VKPEAAGGLALLRPVPLQELRLRADALTWPVDQKLADLDSLTPVRGQVSARHHGSVLEVEGEAETIVTLCCDRCLQHFNRPLRASVHELLELAGGEEAEAADLTALAGSQNRHQSRTRTKANPEPLVIEVLDDRLDPRGDFDPERWLFEQLSLQLPVVNHCGTDCPGPPLAPGAANPAGSSPIDVTSPDGIEAVVLISEPPNDREPDREPKPPVDPRWAALRRLLP